MLETGVVNTSNDFSFQLQLDSMGWEGFAVSISKVRKMKCSQECESIANGKNLFLALYLKNRMDSNFNF